MIPLRIETDVEEHHVTLDKFTLFKNLVGDEFRGPPKTFRSREPVFTWHIIRKEFLSNVGSLRFRFRTVIRSVFIQLA